ncbi:DPP IV N-terminal domain-containing protein [Elizabethkingia sp. JS20170427COW]|uniref:S9 family peptidase n=1 Tax=Elizabethkingia sp. JS20170427COW TaxID=2583851 RepID=UPI0011108470|nr:DPP IV N-terminal domain-containing protein [Elizabethkingia sp. JS20170427COW]QCX52963.1 S9 family peptidase [Elizabethkingia sp. JS20170427COW]
MRLIISMVLLGLGCSLSYGQQQKYTMAEAVNGLRSNLAVKNIYQASWVKKSDIFVQNVGKAYLGIDFPSQKQDTLIRLMDLQKSLGGLASMPNLQFETKEKAYFKKDSIYYVAQKDQQGWSTASVLSLPSAAENIFTFKNKKAAAFTLRNNLFFKDASGSKQISFDKDEAILNGQAVHRNEFGINKGIFIAPNEEKIAFYRMDQTMVKDYPIIDWSVVPAVNHNIKYPMAGQASHEVSLGIYDVKTNTTRFLQIEGPKDQYLISVAWAPDSRSILVGILNRDQNDLKMNQYDAVSGKFIKTIFEEKNDKYVDPQNSAFFLPNSQTEFLWLSQRDGFNHFYLYDLKKGLQKQVTSGAWEVTQMLGFNAQKSEVYFVSTKETPLERHLYKVNYKNSKITRLDKAEGMHTGVLNDLGTYLYDSYSNATTPRSANIINTQNSKITNLLTAENPLSKYANATVKNVTLKAEDGTPLYGKLMLPADFDPNKKYPTIVYLYNGPHAQLITNSFPESGNLWYDLMTQKGYIVFSMDGRGSYNRGLKFEQATFRNLGEVEMKDQLKGVDYLKSLPYVDTDRLGIHGWSYGGFMTTSFMLKYPEVFKVGVAGGPVIDWRMYEIMYTERYMDTPQTNPEGFAKANLLDKIQNLKGKLLLIHGAQDDVVVWQHSIDMLKSAVDHNVQLDYFVYPGHPHNVIGKDRVNLMQKITDYYEDYLKNKEK